MGHKPGYEFKAHQKSAQGHNDPSHYRPEEPSSNRSHKGEDKTGSYKGP